ncbi:hypothetical protein V2A60_008936 [Cordyceps javanica]|uniref:Uncharacterized protein n=1 Tax=Cordyceps javanica TaxID=43265 RepID=A0A545VN69_9HYPO|nr:hypothetical protein IF1G_09916 [Cordyceps javanica]TQW03167.1 hypothetical protein IF2G_09300 [Cordyceps javanica]
MIGQRLAARATAAARPATTMCGRVVAAHQNGRMLGPAAAAGPRPRPRPYSTQAYPTVTDSGFWKSLVPKPLRRENRGPARGRGSKSRAWNPATYFIVMFLFVGSMSIQMIALRNQTSRYMRQASVRLQLLREVVERIQAGEDVDVEKMLGTGEPQKEADWEEVLQAIEREEAMKKSRPKEVVKPQSEPAPETPEAAAPAQSSEQTSTKSTGFGSFF